MKMPKKENINTVSTLQNTSITSQNGIKTEEDLQHEFKELLKSISTEVMDSTVNQSIKEASFVIQKQVPEIDKLVSKLQTEADEFQRVKQDLSHLLNKYKENNKQPKMDEHIKKMENKIDHAVSYLETETKNSFKQLSSLVIKNNERIDKLERVIMLQTIKQEETMQAKVENTIKKWSLLILAGVGILLSIFL